MKRKYAESDARKAVGNNGCRPDDWINASTLLCEQGGFEAQTESYRFQLRIRCVSVIKRFAGPWYGWVSGEMCCRFVPECARGFFVDDLEQWQIALHNKNASLPSGDTPVKTLFEPRGRITIPDVLALTIGIKRNQQILVRPRRGFLEVWSPDSFTAHCARSAKHPILGYKVGYSDPTRLIPCKSEEPPRQEI